MQTPQAEKHVVMEEESESEHGSGCDDFDELWKLEAAKLKAAVAPKANAKAKPMAKLPELLQNLPEPCPPVPQGFVRNPTSGTVIGRVAVQFFQPVNPSAHVSCRHPSHKSCSCWVTLKHVPETGSLRQWIQIQDRFKTADEHLGHFNLLVYGTPKGPTGTLKPGG